MNIAQLLFAALAIAYDAGWAAEDGDGRLELTLAQPLSRAAVVVERIAVLALVAAAIAAASGLALYVASHAQGIDLDAGRLIAASAMLVPFTLRSEEHTSELQSQSNLVCRLLLEKKNMNTNYTT